MARPTPLQLPRDGLMDFVVRETELAKTELASAAKHAGISSAFIAAAVTFLLYSLWMLMIVLAPVLSRLISLTGLDTVGCLILGLLVAALPSIGIAVLLVFMACGRFQKVKAPTATIEEARAMFVALADAAISQLTEVVMKEEPSPSEAS